MVFEDVDAIRTTLLERRDRLAAAIKQVPNNANPQQLLVEVDAALGRVASDFYGFCEICAERIEWHRLEVDPLLRYCNSHVAPEEQVKVLREQALARHIEQALAPHPEPGDEFRAVGKPEPEELPKPAARARAWAWELQFGSWRVLEGIKTAWNLMRSGVDKRPDLHLDIDRAALLQSELLPRSHLRLEAWEVYYDYASPGPVGGDYCDLVPANTGELFLFFGDAMGKGIAASMIASRLHAVFRTLLDLKMPIHEMVERANRIFCECVLIAGYYATLVCCRASSAGTVELINAGHLPPLLLRRGGAERLLATGMPLGLFYASKYDVTHLEIKPGETLLFYTDGVTEARNRLNIEYGAERLARLATGQRHLAPEELVRVCRDDLSSFTSSDALSDDLTLLALRRM